MTMEIIPGPNPNSTFPTITVGLNYRLLTNFATWGWTDAGVPTSIASVFKKDNGLGQDFPTALQVFYQLNDVTATNSGVAGGVYSVDWIRAASGGYTEVFGGMGQVIVEGSGTTANGQATGQGMECFVEAPIEFAFSGRCYMQVDAAVTEGFGFGIEASFNAATATGGGIRIKNIFPGSNVTDLYGILIGNISGGLTNSYAIYTNSGKVHLGSSIEITGAALTDAVNDAAAAIAGVAVGQMYRNGSVLMIRVT